MSWDSDKTVGGATVSGSEWNDMTSYIQSGILSSGIVGASTLYGSTLNSLTLMSSRLQASLINDLVAMNYDIHNLRTATFNSEYIASSNITSSTFAIDWTNGLKQKIVVGTNTTLTFTAPSGPCNMQCKAVQSSAGAKTLTWPTMLWAGGIVASLTTTSNAVDIFSIYYDGTNYYCVASQDFK